MKATILATCLLSACDTYVKKVADTNCWTSINDQDVAAQLRCQDLAYRKYGYDLINCWYNERESVGTIKNATNVIEAACPKEGPLSNYRTRK